MQEAVRVLQGLNEAVPMIQSLSEAVLVIQGLKEAVPILQGLREAVPMIQDLNEAVPVLQGLHAAVPSLQGLDNAVSVLPAQTHLLGNSFKIFWKRCNRYSTLKMCAASTTTKGIWKQLQVLLELCQIKIVVHLLHPICTR